MKERKWHSKFVSLFKKYFGVYRIDNPTEIAKESPYTFFLPDPIALDALIKDDIVKLMFTGSTFGYHNGTERMWVIIDNIIGDTFTGRLDNDPFGLDQLQAGDPIAFAKDDILDFLFIKQGAERLEALKLEKKIEYWQRCDVDNRILDGTRKVTNLHRDVPREPTSEEMEKGHEPSGWWLSGWLDEDQADGYRYDPENTSYVALGAVLNKDDRWLHLLDSPPNSAFRFDCEKGEYVAWDYIEPS